MSDEPKRWRQMLLPWAEEERGELLKRLENMSAELKQAKGRKDMFSSAIFLAGLGAIMWTMGHFSNYMEKKGKMLSTEWKLKYDEQGKPREEYWSGRTLTEQALEPSWVKYLAERGEPDGKQKTKS
jgi:hypothetical protein